MARTLMITIRVDEAEHALFKEAAWRVSISMSEYARDAMLARMALEEGAARVVVSDRSMPAPTKPRVSDAAIGGPAPSRVIESPAEVPAAVERVAPSRTSDFTPYSKEQQTGRVKKKAKAEPVATCRHGLLRCKVCGTGE